MMNYKNSSFAKDPAMVKKGFGPLVLLLLVSVCAIAVTLLMRGSIHTDDQYYSSTSTSTSTSIGGMRSMHTTNSVIHDVGDLPAGGNTPNGVLAAASDAAIDASISATATATVVKMKVEETSQNCCVPASGNFGGTSFEDSKNPFETCWGDHKGNYCWSHSYWDGTYFEKFELGDWEPCKPNGVWGPIAINGNTNNVKSPYGCGSPCGKFAAGLKCD